MSHSRLAQFGSCAWFWYTVNMPMSSKEEQRRYQREWVARRRKEWLQVNGPCVDCGSWDKLEVDHVDPSIKITHAVWSWRKERREEELAKCVTRCEECHKKRTCQQQSRRFCVNGHDTELVGRDKSNKRCKECRREDQRRYRAAQSKFNNAH